MPSQTPKQEQLDSTTPDMPSLQNLHKHFTHLLSDFSKSPKELFRILYTHPPPRQPNTDATSSIDIHTSPFKPRHKCQKLLVLDSSFNPPSRAHLGVAQAAVLATTSTRSLDSSAQRQGQHEQSTRLLLLLATENADKAPKPTGFADRLVMMVLMAQSLQRSLATARSGADAAQPGRSELDTDIEVDIGVTKKPYFMDKAAAIDESGIYYSPSGGDASVEATPEQTHLTGFDTLTRIFDPKYYPSELGLAALAPFLEKHRVRAMLRTGEGGKYGEREAQEGWLEGLAGEEAKGFKRGWLERVELVDDEEVREVKGVSSTRVREGVKAEDWGLVRDLVGQEVEGWIRERGLYAEEQGEGGGDGKL